MTTRNSPNAEQNFHGIILRTSATFSGRYAYFPLTSDGATTIDNNFADSLTNAPHYPNITILDSISSNILYQTYNTFPDFLHIYNLINRSHFALSFPHSLTFVNAAIVIHDCTHFKVLVVCINEHPNPFFASEGSSSSSSNGSPLVFYIYSSERRNWSLVPTERALTSAQLISNRRKPVHTGENIVYLDLTDHYLVRFGYWDKKVEVITKLALKLEMENNSIKLDEATRYGECNGELHCVKFNPLKKREDVYKWNGPPLGTWNLVMIGKPGRSRGKVLGIHPTIDRVLLMRSKVDDEVLMVDIQRDFSWVIIERKGARCSPVCFRYGMNDLLEAAMAGDAALLQPSSCGILHPHENVEGPEGDFFVVSLNGSQLSLLISGPAF